MARIILLVGLSSAIAFAADPLTFGASASLDYRFISGPKVPTNPSALGINSLGLEVAAKAVVDIGHGASFTIKACGGCHGIELDQAFGEVLYVDALNVRAGRINVPFGEFNTRHDPANFVTPSKPLPYAMGDMLFYTPQGFNLGIVPTPFIDNGVEVFGTFNLGPKAQLDYSLYAGKGLAGTNDYDFASSRAYLDNNRTPSAGARVVLAGADWAVGGSVNAGAYDPKDSLLSVMAGVELYLRLGRVTFRGEGLLRRTDLDPGAGYAYEALDTFIQKVGWYGQLDFELNRKFVLAVRSDGLHRFGLPLPGSDLSPSAGMQRQTVAGLFRITENFALKADYELWTFSGVAYQTRHVARLALVFGY